MSDYKGKWFKEKAAGGGDWDEIEIVDVHGTTCHTSNGKTIPKSEFDRGVYVRVDAISADPFASLEFQNLLSDAGAAGIQVDNEKIVETLQPEKIAAKEETKVVQEEARNFNVTLPNATNDPMINALQAAIIASPEGEVITIDLSVQLPISIASLKTIAGALSISNDKAADVLSKNVVLNNKEIHELVSEALLKVFSK